MDDIFCIVSFLTYSCRKVPVSEPKDASVLPQEIWLHILSYLQSQDLCHVALVSWEFYTICCDPSLWTEAPLNETKLVKEGIQKLTSIKRFSKLKTLELPSRWGLSPEQWETLFLDLDRSNLPIESMNLSKVDFRQVSCDLLARVLCRLQRIDLAGASLTEEQCLEFLRCTANSTTLQNLTLEWYNTNTRSVPPPILGQAVLRLKTVSLCGTKLNKEQLETVLEAILSSETLKNVDLSYNNLSQVDSELLANAVCRMVTVKLTDTELSNVQSTAILSKIMSSGTLEEINLNGTNLEEVTEELLAKSVASVKKVSLRDSVLTAKQYSTLLFQGLMSETLESLRVNGVWLSFYQSELTTAVSRSSGLKVKF